jgi:hypothetical protein
MDIRSDDLLQVLLEPIRRSFAFFVLLALTIIGSPLARRAAAISAGKLHSSRPTTRPDCPRRSPFAQKIQDALKSNNREAVALLAHYPLLVPDSIGRTTGLSESELHFRKTIMWPRRLHYG